MRKFLALVLVCLTTSFCFSQANFFDNYVYQSWSAFNGLSGTTANDIYQTRDGYIDIGTYEGLVKFDGVEFVTLNRVTNKDFGFVSVRTILQDSRGDIWLGSNDEGLQKVSEAGKSSDSNNNSMFQQNDSGELGQDGKNSHSEHNKENEQNDRKTFDFIHKQAMEQNNEEPEVTNSADTLQTEKTVNIKGSTGKISYKL